MRRRTPRRPLSRLSASCNSCVQAISKCLKRRSAHLSSIKRNWTKIKSIVTIKIFLKCSCKNVFSIFQFTMYFQFFNFEKGTCVSIAGAVLLIKCSCVKCQRYDWHPTSRCAVTGVFHKEKLNKWKPLTCGSLGSCFFSLFSFSAGDAISKIVTQPVPFC